MIRLFVLSTVLSLITFPVSVSAEGKSPYTPEDLHRLHRVSDPAVSPDGKWVAFVVKEQDFDENKSSSDIWMVPAEGGAPRQMTTSPKSDNTPRWSPDGKMIAFLSGRDEDGDVQIWLLPADGGEARRVTDFPGGVDDVAWTPDGKSLLFPARVYPDCENLACTEERDEAKEEDKVSAMVHEHLLYRHWMAYEDGKTQHLFVVSVNPPGTTGAGEPRDLTPGLRYDALIYWLASAGREYDFSPDGTYIYFAGNQDDDQAVSYNMEIYRASLGGTQGEGIDPGEGIEKITSNPAADGCPRVSPDGSRLAYRATGRPGYEADRYELMVMDLGTRSTQSLTREFDRSVGDLFWSTDGKTLFFEAEDRGDINLFAVPAAGGTVRTVIGGEGPTGQGYHLDVRLAEQGFFVYRYRNFAHSYEIYRCEADGSDPRPLTAVNGELYEEVYIPDADEIWYKGAGGDLVQGFVLRPLDFDPSKKYPMMVRIHGGPQQTFGRAFRNEYAIFTGAGYVVFFCNPRGSTAFGQKFCDEIRGDWGGKVVKDIRAGVKHVIKKYPFVDPERIGAWGGSFGGFMCNWIEGHNDDKLFAALVSHAGDADQWSAYGSTEELWFPEWEMLGTPWENSRLYDKLSPIRYAGDFATPMLITHGELDYRVPITGSEQMFTALQRRGVPSKFIRFPDEGHWIMKPQNRRFWYGSILDWFDQWLKRGGVCDFVAARPR